MRIAFLLGAGCPVSIRIPEANNQTRPLIPDIAGLTSLVSNILSDDDALKDSYSKLLARFDADSRPNIEEILSHLRALLDVVRQGVIDDLNHAVLQALDTKICELIASQVKAPLPEVTTPYHYLAAWISATSRTHPIEVFTPNYDLLVEQAFESRRVPYFDGFVGSREAFFDLTSMESDALPARWARLWKLHGSINWWRTATDDVVRKEQNSTGDRHMIYPSHLKYEQSRRLPYLAMLDRLRDFLGRGQAVVVCCGYSFADQHLNEVIMNGLRSNPTAMCFGLMYGSRVQYKEGMLCASRHPNLSLLAEDGAVLGTLDRDWHNNDGSAHPLHGLSARFEPAATEGQTARNTFLLGDFKKLGEFLAYQLNRSDDHVSPATA